MKMIQLFLLLLLTTSPAIQAADTSTASDPITKTLVWPDGTRYVGGVIDGKRSGKGTIFWQDGTRFVGQFDNDMRNGPGTMILPDGTVYTGFFKNDELVDTESTIAAAKTSPQEGLDAAQTVAALEDTELPFEADSLSGDAPADPIPAPETKVPVQVDEYDLITPTAEKSPPPAIAAKEPEPVIEPEIAATTTPEAPAVDESPTTGTVSTDVTIITDEVKQDLIDSVDRWAAAWSNKNVAGYLASYSEQFSVPGRQSRRTWEALRKTRLSRPRFINLDVDYQRFELVETNIVDVFFRQSYRSDTYSDLADKVLRLQKEGDDWKILIERSR